MKRITKLLVTAMTVVFCCFIAKAQLNYTGQLNYTNALSGGFLIYSNSFNGGAVDIHGTVPTYINPNAANYGGSLSAEWDVITDSVPNNAYAYQNGTLGVHDNGIYLPFTPTNGYIYNFSATLTWIATPPAGDWDAIGYDTVVVNPIFHSATDPRPSTEGGNPWTLLNMFANGDGAIFYQSPSTIVNYVPNLMTQLNTPYVINLVLDTTTTNWTAAEYVAGTIIYTHTYANGSHANIASFGYGQTTSVAGDTQWGPITLSAVPLAIIQEPASANVNEGIAYTNTVAAGGTPPFAYQWFTNGVALANATNSTLIFSPVTNSNASTDYYCVVTNAYGAVTSAPATLAVYTVPQIVSANPITYTNLMTLFGGNGAYLGSSPTFSVGGGGAVPLTYFWLTNGVAVGGASSPAFTYTNIQFGGPTSFACIVSNSLGTATNTWLAQIVPTPTAPYPQMVLTDGPVGYWRLDETNYDVNQYNDGQVCNDFMSGNNGLYINTELAQPGYYVVSNSIPVTNDPTETSAGFAPADASTDCDANSIGTNVDFSASSNAEFSVSIWANGSSSPNYYGTSGSEPADGGIVIKGYFGTEEYGLDCGGSGNTVRFFIRTAGNVVESASSTLQLGNNQTWHHLVGVCDESNNVINLYVDGLLAVQTAGVKGLGVLPEPNEPITIGASTTAGTLTGDHQFDGALDDCAIFPYALNASQVNGLYAAAGGVNPLSFTAPLPPTNAVWRQNTTLTIPATAFGLPPLGYYWTNLTTQAIVSGSNVHGATGSSAVSTLTCTLTITNAAPSLSGDLLELVVTNAGSMTNLFVTLFSYPPPITIGYTNSILYSNEFDGGTWNVAGTATTVANSLVGGTNTTWLDATGTNNTGSLEGSGLDNTALGDSWLLPFTPEPGFIYTLTTVETFYGYPGNWIGMGFVQSLVTNATSGQFSGAPDWMLVEDNANANIQCFDGNTQIGDDNGFFNNANPGTHTNVVVLNTTQPQWTEYFYMDGVEAPLGLQGAGPTTNIYASNPTISGVGITQDALTTAGDVPNDVVWDSFSLTAVSPNGFPPYLLNPTPSTSAITLTNTTVTFTNVTGYGTGPWGYYWINNANTLTSGATNNTAPNSANLSVASSSLSAGNLELVLTNALGTNITIIPLLSGFPTAQTNLTITVTNNIVYVSWPTAYDAAQLQAQTNPVTLGIGTNWVNFNPNGPGTGTGTNRFAFPLNTTNGTVFFRYRH